MVSKPQESTLLEAVKNMLDDVALGDKTHKNRRDEETANTFTFLHEEIEQHYRLSTINLTHHDSICSAFNKIHSHKYLDDPGFALSMRKEMTARGIPLEEQVSALAAVETVRSKFIQETGEKDAGWNPDLDSIKDVSQPKQIEESKDNFDTIREFYNDKKVRRWLESRDDFKEAVQYRVSPILEQIGYRSDDLKHLWEALDENDMAIDFMIRNRLYELYEKLHAEWQSKNA